MINSIFLFAMFVAQPTNELPKRELPTVSIQKEYAEKPQELEFNEYIGFYYTA